MPIPDDIIEEILLRLPAKSLVRFKCISKRCVSVINNPRFARDHRRIHRNYSVLFDSGWAVNMIDDNVIEKVKDDDSVDWISGSKNQSKTDYDGLEFPTREIHRSPLNGAFCLRCCCDGILCGLFFDRGEHKENADIMLWNPTINEYKTLLPPPDWNHWNLWNPFTIGFGYDPSLDDYKIVLFPKCIGGKVRALRLKSNSWRTICTNFPYDILKISHWQAVKANGKLYSIAHLWKMYTIIEFDIAAETFSEVSIPSGCDANYISTSDDCLYLCCSRKRGLEYNLSNHELWVMKQEKNWIELRSFSMTGLLKPLYFTKEDVLIMYSSAWSNILCIYDPKLDICKKLKTSPQYDEDEVFAYCFSLISPLRQ